MNERSAIMMTDIVGFTELTSQDQSSVRKIGQKHRNVLQDAVSGCHGRIVNIFGDSSLSVFQDPVDAVRSAVEIQRSADQEPVIPMRIALHVGAIVVEGGEVYGESINLASRMLKLAIPGSVLLSDRLIPFLEHEEGIETRSIGLFHLKYVERPVEIFGVCNEGLVLPELTGQEREEAIPPSSVAVMPFVNLGRDRANDYLGEGISEAIIDALAKLKGVFVTARSSSFSLKGLQRDIREVGRILGVAHVLEGSVQKHENRLRVTAQLIDSHTGFHLFSETYDTDLIDIFSIQEEIAWLIGRRLREKIETGEKDQLALPRTANSQALEYYMQARSHMTRTKRNEILKAIELFKRSIEADPGYVMPYAGISLCYIFLGALRHLDAEVSSQKSEEYAIKASGISPTLPEVIVVRALSSFWGSNWNLKSMERIMVEALRTAPGSSEVRLFHGMFILMSGNVQDALIEIQLANKLDPLNPGILSRLGYAYLCARDFEEAHNCFRLAHNSAPFAMYIQYILAWSYLLQQRYDRAESALLHVDEERDVYQSIQGTLGFIYARQGRPDKAYDQIRLIDRMNEEGTIRFPHYNFALVYAGLDKREEMFYHLERAFSEKPVHLMFFQADPFWDQFRDEKCYNQLVNRVFKREATSRKITLCSDTREKLVVETDRILFIEAEDNYSRVIWREEEGRKEKILRTTLGKLEEQLSGTGITRCHRSYLVNLSRYSISGDSRGLSLVSSFDPFKVPVSRSRSREIMARLNP